VELNGRTSGGRSRPWEGISLDLSAIVSSTPERKGSPYSLVLTKITGSFERALKRFEADHRLFSELPPEP
jgi:hypothetical protein